MNFPEDRNLSTTIRNNRRIDRGHIAQIKIFGRLLVQIQKGQHCTELLCRAETKDNIQIPISALPVENHLARDVGLGACPQHTFAKCFMPHLLQLCPDNSHASLNHAHVCKMHSYIIFPRASISRATTAPTSPSFSLLRHSIHSSRICNVQICRHFGTPFVLVFSRSMTLYDVL